MADESKNSKQIQSSTEAHRSYLQRSEVRLSTMHRIAGSFLGGAGLLLLLPAFFRDPLTIVIAMFFKYAPPVTAAWDLGTTYGTMLLSIPILVAFLIPVWAFWLLLKDLTHFYFTANIPNSGELEKAGQDPAFHPRFSLMALSPADDECGEEKPKIRARQFNTPMRYFVLPHSAVDKAWLTKLVETRDGGRVALARDDKQLVECDDCDDKDRLRMAFGLAGVHNRDLIDEVAIAELSQVRHNLYL